MLNRERDRDRGGHHDRYCCCSIALMAMGHYRHRTLSFRDDINESNRQFHRGDWKKSLIWSQVDDSFRSINGH